MTKDGRWGVRTFKQQSRQKDYGNLTTKHLHEEKMTHDLRCNNSNLGTNTPLFISAAYRTIKESARVLIDFAFGSKEEVASNLMTFLS